MVNAIDNSTSEKASLDGLINVVTRLGTNHDKRMQNQWTYDLLSDFQQLDAAYQTNWIARQIVDVPARDMTREWRRIKSDDAEEIERHEQDLDIQNNVKDATSWARLFGGAGVLMLTGQDLSQPLRVRQVKKGDLQRVLVFDRWELSPKTLNTWDVLAPNYLQPEFYTLQGGYQQIHWTHIVRFMGEKLPRRQLAQTNGWGDSVLRKCLQDITDTVSAKNGIATLMQEANIDTLTRESLSTELASDQEDAIIARYQLFAQMKSIVNLALLDGEEELDRKTLNLSGVAPIIETFITWISGAARIPVTKLFGTSAKGMNATGEGDMKNYYDDIRAMQMSELVPPMRVLDQVLIRSAIGFIPENYDYEWNPLHQQNEVEAAQSELLRAQKDEVYLNANIVQPSQVMRELQGNEEYQFNEQLIDELEKLEDPLLFAELPTANTTPGRTIPPPVTTSEQIAPATSATNRPTGPVRTIGDEGPINNGYVSVRPTPETAAALITHLRSIGIRSPIPAEDLHVTLMHSDVPINDSADPDKVYKAYIGMEYDILGNSNALVVDLFSEELDARFAELYLAGGQHNFPEYRPHMSLKYEATAEDLQAIIDNPFSSGEIVLTGERFEPVDTDG